MARATYRHAPIVVSLNLLRRHLTTSQRSAVAVDVKKQLEAEGMERIAAGQQKGTAATKAKGSRANLPESLDTVVCVAEVEPPREEWRSRDEAARLMRPCPARR
jgi:hypothetical protein